MGFFDFFKTTDINAGLELYHTMPNAVLLDVRTPQEYAQGRIPGSRNVALQNLNSIPDKIANHDTPIFTYCQSGARSGQAASALKSMGYTDVRNIGGINRYQGRMEW